MKLNKLISYYKDLFKDLSIDTINTPTFKSMLEFDILIRFDYRISKKEISLICEAIINNNQRSYNNGKNFKKKWFTVR